jgi:dTDP-4-dehydrorhamnose 3,5-epimerase
MLPSVEQEIEGVSLIEFQKFLDSRGSFMEIYRNSGDPDGDKILFEPTQINLSTSQKGVIRGLHFSLAPESQDKLIVVCSGKILDTILDVRIGSPTFGEHVQIELSSENNKAIHIKSGLAHGFSVLSESATIVYLMSSHYQPDLEQDINPLDPDLKINWNVSKPVVSSKDSAANSLQQAKELGLLPAISIKNE